ncbi:MAG: GntR family transcriptional regulator [Vallitaleaceae bacterium]|nr:GntR family transcriptional regulator [Vallitaleaceae bacterium]
MEVLVGNYNLHEEGSDKYSLRGRVFTKIREDILTGVYKTDDAIIESQVAKEFGVSRTPVREALRQLELEELVVIIPNKGAIVTGINGKDIQDIYMIRSLIEGLAAKMAAIEMSKEEIESLDEIIILSEFHLEKRNMDKLYELDGRFHEMLYDGSKSKILRHVLSDFHHYVQRVRKESLSSLERAQHSIDEHKKIFEAIKGRNPDLAESLTNQHVQLTIENVYKRKITDQFI